MDKLTKLTRFGSLFNRILVRSCYKPTIQVRTLLSGAFSCKEEWEKRLQEPIIKNIQLEEFTYELDKKHTRDRKVSAIDVDLFTNKITEEGHLEVLEEMVYRLRRCPNTIHMYPSTGHAFIRTLLQFKKYDDILRVLDDRVNYGIFPDPYLSCLLMDTFIKSKDYTSAAKIASFMMLQEDFGDSLSASMALYSCHMYRKDPSIPWYKVSEEEVEEKKEGEEEEDDDEINEVRERVDFLREPHFDDHFDLREPKYLVGKTLANVGKLYDNVLGRSYQLIGLAMYRKWDQAKKLVEKMLESGKGPLVCKDAIEAVKGEISTIISEEKKAEVEKDFGPILEKLGKLASQENLDDLVDKFVKEEVAKNESNTIKAQAETYATWSQQRDQALKVQIHAQLREHTVKSIKEKKKELADREELLYFFENFETHALKLDKQPTIGEEIAAFEDEEEKPQYHITDLEEDYVDGLFMPPDSLREKFKEATVPKVKSKWK